MNKTTKIGVLAALCVLISGIVSAGQTSTFLKNRHAKGATVTLDGKWYRDFSKCKAYADKHGVPLIAVWSNGDACPHCTKFENACDSSVFKNWMKTSGCVFYFTYPGDGGEGKMESDVFHWIRGDNTAFPFVRVYWYVNGKKKANVYTIGDVVDNNAKGSTGGKAAVDYFKKVLKGYKYTPAPVVPKYTGGVFGVGDTDSDRLEAEVGVTDWVDVPVVRTNAASVAVVSTNSLVVTYPNGSEETHRIDWAASDSAKSVRVTTSGLAAGSAPVKLVLLNAAGAGVATNHITIVSSTENKPSNPLWIGEKTADELDWGEWTMDLDVAQAKVAAYNAGTGNATSGNGPKLLADPPAVDRAYTLVLLEGALWCPDCKKTDAYLLEKPAFTEWARSNKVALVALDLPYGDKTATSPTLLTYDQRFGASGASYISRKMIDADQADEILARNFAIAQKLRLPNWSNATRPPVPSLFILRDDGTIAARNQYFGGVKSPTSDADLAAHLLRLDEMLAQADMPEEESNDDIYRTTEVIGIREKVGADEVKSISFTDSADVYRLDPAATGGKRMTFAVEGTANTSLRLQLIKALSSSSSVVLASATGNVSEGVTLGATVPSSADCYISVGYATTSSMPDDAYFAVASKSSTVCPYVLSTDFVVEPTELASDNDITLTDGNLELTVALSSNQLYRITGLDGTANAEYLVPYEGGTTDCLYTSVFEGDARLAFLTPTMTIQKWNPGKVGFVAQRASVAESAGSYFIRVVRDGGASGRATATVSFTSSQYDGLIEEFAPVELAWEEGDTAIKEAKVVIAENSYADGDQVVLFGAVTGGDAEAGVTEFRLTIRDNDKATPGKIAMVATEPAMAKPMTVFARKGGSVTISLGRVDGATGLQEVSLATSGGSLDAGEFSWSNRASAVENAVLTLPNATGKVKVTLTPEKGSFVDASRRILDVNILAADAPGFAVDAVTIDATRFIPMEAASVALDEKEATAVKMYSGSLPQGVQWSFDADGKKLVFAGVPKKGGTFTSVYRAYNGSTAGLTVAVTFVVADPVVEGGGEDGSQPLNAAVANTITIPDVTVLKSGTNIVAGVLTLTLPRSGRASAKFRSVELGAVTLSSASWDAIDAANGTLSATLTGKAGEETLSLAVSVAADGTVALVLDGYEFILPETKWAKSNSASDFKGYYTCALPYVGTLVGDAPARGTGGVTLKMNSASAINSGKVTFAGFLPSGKAFSGTATLAAKGWTGGFWGSAVLPLVSIASSDTFAGAVAITPGSWDKTATNMVDTLSGTCAGRCYYRTIRRSVSPVGGTRALWRHVDKAAAASGEVALDVKGTYYDAAENFVSCCQSSHGTPDLTFFLLDGINETAALGGFSMGDVDVSLFDPSKAAVSVTYAKATKTAKTKTSQINKASTAKALSSLSFTLSTGLVTGSLKVDGITFTYKGVVMPGWGSQDCTSCGYSVDVDGGREAQFHPFISGSAWFNDTIEYKDAKGKTRTSTVRRSTPFSVGVNPGE